MGLKKFLKRNFIFACVKGKNNKIIAIKDGKELPFRKPSHNFKISGDNNTIIINYDKMKKISRKMPVELKINIKGNNNRIEIEYPQKITNVRISMSSDNNLFSMKATSNKFANASFTIDDGSQVIIGNDSEIGNGQLCVICNGHPSQPHKLVLGDNVHIARDTIIRTSDGQSIIDEKTGKPINEPQDIYIGNHVWIMSRCMVVKGAYIPDGCAVAPYSFVNKKFNTNNSLIAGIPAKIKKENFHWSTLNYKKQFEKYMAENTQTLVPVERERERERERESNTSI